MTTSADDTFVADTMVEPPLMSDLVPPLFLEDDDDGCLKNRCPCLSRSRNFWIFASGLILLMAGMAGLVLVLYNHPSLTHTLADTVVEDPAVLAAELTRIRQENDGYYRSYRTSVAQMYQGSYGSYGPYMFMRPNSPQKLAMQWMAYSDTLRMLPYNLTGANYSSTSTNTSSEVYIPASRWIQRFALMTIFFDNDGEQWAAFGGNGASDNSSDTLFTTYTNGTGVVDDADLAGIPTLQDASVVATIGSPWSRNIDIHECEWALVECDDEEHVIKLSFGGPGVKLRGILSKEIGFLHRIRHLDLSKNQLKGIIPNEIFGLTSLGKW
jgi:hypothetical protein